MFCEKTLSARVYVSLLEGNSLIFVVDVTGVGLIIAQLGSPDQAVGLGRFFLGLQAGLSFPKRG
jgi:hypothetical protein